MEMTDKQMIKIADSIQRQLPGALQGCKTIKTGAERFCEASFALCEFIQSRFEIETAV